MEKEEAELSVSINCLNCDEEFPICAFCSRNISSGRMACVPNGEEDTEHFHWSCWERYREAPNGD